MTQLIRQLRAFCGAYSQDQEGRGAELRQLAGQFVDELEKEEDHEERSHSVDVVAFDEEEMTASARVLIYEGHSIVTSIRVSVAFDPEHEGLGVTEKYLRRILEATALGAVGELSQ